MLLLKLISLASLLISFKSLSVADVGSADPTYSPTHADQKQTNQQISEDLIPPTTDPSLNTLGNVPFGPEDIFQAEHNGQSDSTEVLVIPTEPEHQVERDTQAVQHETSNSLELEKQKRRQMERQEYDRRSLAHVLELSKWLERDT